MSETHRIEVSNIKKFNIVKKRFEVKGILVVFCALNNNNYTTVYIQALMELLTISSALIKKKKIQRRMELPSQIHCLIALSAQLYFIFPHLDLFVTLKVFRTIIYWAFHWFLLRVFITQHLRCPYLNIYTWGLEIVMEAMHTWLTLAQSSAPHMFPWALLEVIPA